MLVGLASTNEAAAQSKDGGFSAAPNGWNLKKLPNLIDGRWQLFASNQYSSDYFDKQSITGDGYQMAVWVKSYLSKGYPDFSGTIYHTSSISHIFVRCTERTLAEGEKHMYAMNGLEVRDGYVHSDSKKLFDPIQPGDRFKESIFKLACKQSTY